MYDYVKKKNAERIKLSSYHRPIGAFSTGTTTFGSGTTTYEKLRSA